MQSHKRQIIAASGFALVMFQVSAAFAQQVAAASPVPAGPPVAQVAPAAPASATKSGAPVATHRRRMDRREAEAVLQREKTAWILSSIGVGAGVGMITLGGGLMDTKNKKCDKMADEDRAKVECRRDALELGTPLIVLGSAAAIGGLVTFVLVRPSRAEREAAEQAARPDVQIHVDPVHGAYSASIRAAF